VLKKTGFRRHWLGEAPIDYKLKKSENNSPLLIQEYSLFEKPPDLMPNPDIQD
jgi:hypothetical protein